MARVDDDEESIMLLFDNGLPPLERPEPINTLEIFETTFQLSKNGSDFLSAMKFTFCEFGPFDLQVTKALLFATYPDFCEFCFAVLIYFIHSLNLPRTQIQELFDRNFFAESANVVLKNVIDSILMAQSVHPGVVQNFSRTIDAFDSIDDAMAAFLQQVSRQSQCPGVAANSLLELHRATENAYVKKFLKEFLLHHVGTEIEKHRADVFDNETFPRFETSLLLIDVFMQIFDFSCPDKLALLILELFASFENISLSEIQAGLCGFSASSKVRSYPKFVSCFYFIDAKRLKFCLHCGNGCCNQPSLITPEFLPATESNVLTFDEEFRPIRDVPQTKQELSLHLLEELNFFNLCCNCNKYVAQAQFCAELAPTVQMAKFIGKPDVFVDFFQLLVDCQDNLHGGVHCALLTKMCSMSFFVQHYFDLRNDLKQAAIAAGEDENEVIRKAEKVCEFIQISDSVPLSTYFDASDKMWHKVTALSQTPLGCQYQVFCTKNQIFLSGQALEDCKNACKCPICFAKGKRQRLEIFWSFVQPIEDQREGGYTVNEHAKFWNCAKADLRNILIPWTRIFASSKELLAQEGLLAKSMGNEFSYAVLIHACHYQQSTPDDLKIEKQALNAPSLEKLHALIDMRKKLFLAYVYSLKE